MKTWRNWLIWNDCSCYSPAFLTFTTSTIISVTNTHHTLLLLLTLLFILIYSLILLLPLRLTGKLFIYFFCSLYIYFQLLHILLSLHTWYLYIIFKSSTDNVYIWIIKKSLSFACQTFKLNLFCITFLVNSLQYYYQCSFITWK